MCNRALLLFFGAASAFLGWQSTSAAVFNIADGDVAGLKSAITASNTNSEDDTIELASNGTYTLTTVDNPGVNGANGLPIIGTDGGHTLTIRGNGATLQRSTTIETPEFRILHLDNNGRLVLSSLTIANGNIASVIDNFGGGILSDFATLTITDCLFSGNLADYGGGIFNYSGTLDVSDSSFSGNTAGTSSSTGLGGGIYNSGNQATSKVMRCNFTGNIRSAIANFTFETSQVFISDSTFNGNSSDFGAIYNWAWTGATAALTVINSTFNGNSALDGAGGAIYTYCSAGFSTATAFVDRCTFINNSAAVFGGAFLIQTGSSGQENIATLTVTNSTIKNNSAEYGGGIFARNQSAFAGGIVNLTISHSTLSGNAATNGNGGAINTVFSATTQTISNCTISGNSATGLGGNIHFAGGSSPSSTLALRNTILKTGSSGANIHRASGTVLSQGYNLSDDDAQGLLMSQGDQINTDPMLDQAGLQNNGGPTQTIALLPGSPAINSGDPNAPTRDQRYYLRNGVPDKGAFEYGGTLAPTTVVSRKMHGTAGTFDVDLPLIGNAGIECRTGGAGGNHQLVATFATPVTIGSASVSSGTGSISGASVNGSEVTIGLTGVANAQQITLTLSQVNDGAHTNDVNVPMRLLLGDTNGNGTVNASDVSQTKARLGQVLTNLNFRSDVNANGTINASDVW